MFLCNVNNNNNNGNNNPADLSNEKFTKDSLLNNNNTDSDQDCYNQTQTINEILGDDILLIIFRQLKLTDLHRSRGVCRQWCTLIVMHELVRRDTLIIRQALLDRPITATGNGHYGEKKCEKFFTKNSLLNTYGIRCRPQRLIEPLLLHTNLRSLTVYGFILDQWFLSLFAALSDNHNQHNQQQNQKESNNNTKNANRIESICFVQCYFKEIDLAQLFTHLNQMQRFAAISCDGIDSDAAVQLIGENLPHLQHFTLTSGNIRLHGSTMNTLPYRTMVSISLSNWRSLDDLQLANALRQLLINDGGKSDDGDGNESIITSQLKILNLKPQKWNNRFSCRPLPHTVDVILCGGDSGDNRRRGNDHQHFVRWHTLKLPAYIHSINDRLFGTTMSIKNDSSQSSSPAAGVVSQLVKLHLTGFNEYYTPNNTINPSSLPQNINASTIKETDLFLRWFYGSTTQHLTTLTELTLDQLSSHFTTDAGVAHALIHSPNLRKLKLCDMPFLTENSLRYIASLQQLYELKLFNIEVTDKVILDVFDHCHHLYQCVIHFSSAATSTNEDDVAKPYRLTEAVVHCAVKLCEKNCQRTLYFTIKRSLLPTDKLFSVPKNLHLQVIESRFHPRLRAIYVDDPVCN